MRSGPKILYNASLMKTRLSSEISSMVAGCFELLVAELLSHKISLEEIIYGEIAAPPCIIWNGKLLGSIPVNAPRGVADIEAYLSPKEAWVIDATLSSKNETLIFEARRLKTHKPSLYTPLRVTHILVAPSINIESNNIKFYKLKQIIKSINWKKPVEISYWETVKSKILTFITL